jgi:hypothetical protein
MQESKFQVLTGSQEVVSVSDIALVADKQKPTLLIFSRLPIGRFFCCNFFAIRNATTPNDSMVMIHVTTWSHLAGVGSKRTLFVLINGVVIEVV